jgi:hypothetical protein
MPVGEVVRGSDRRREVCSEVVVALARSGGLLAALPGMLLAAKRAQQRTSDERDINAGGSASNLEGLDPAAIGEAGPALAKRGDIEVAPVGRDGHVRTHLPTGADAARRRDKLESADQATRAAAQRNQRTRGDSQRRR